MAESSYKLVLFDIDGTLISTGRAGTRAMNIAFEEMFGVSNGFENVKMAGRTDPAIIREGMRVAGVNSNNGVFGRYQRTYLRHLAAQMETSTGKRVMPGIAEILEKLSRDRSVVVGLLTGNMQEGAQIKLEHLGILRYFEIGAFGSDHDDRNRLLGFALDRYRLLTHREIEPADAMVIGDTPHDIECSKPFGATAVAVATGPYSTEVLATHDPDHLFPDLADVGAFYRLVYAD